MSCKHWTLAMKGNKCLCLECHEWIHGYISFDDYFAEQDNELSAKEYDAKFGTI